MDTREVMMGLLEITGMSLNPPSYGFWQISSWSIGAGVRRGIDRTQLFSLQLHHASPTIRPQGQALNAGARQTSCPPRKRQRLCCYYSFLEGLSAL
jgi:hypothetical protein